MLSNAYFLTKFRFDTAENEPAKNFAKIVQNYVKFAKFEGTQQRVHGFPVHPLVHGLAPVVLRRPLAHALLVVPQWRVLFVNLARTGLNYSFGTKKYCHQIRKFHGSVQKCPNGLSCRKVKKLRKNL